MMKQLLIYVGLTLLVACNSGVKTQQDGQDEDVQEQEGQYGDPINTENAVSGPELLAMLDEQDSVWVTMRATIVSNCQTSGCWMDLDLGTDEVVKVTFKDYAFVIPIDSKGKTATIEGYAARTIVPVDLLKHYAEDEGRSQEEIDAITMPDTTFMFEAIGVVIED
jgi:hypothetical protein